MASAVNFATLKSQTMSNGEDAPVTVDTRALIDKVLARYSSDWTTLRELIQNAADASATKIIVKFETDPSILVPAPQDADEFTQLKHIISHHVVRRLVVSNNGKPFTQDDWARLKSIANGNPDETKIGAFGVGFYSVFADCDEPFVVSGSKAMAFWWQGSALLTKFADVPAEQASPDTTFVLEYRQTKSQEDPNANPSPVPDLLSLCQFLSTSLTFVGLSDIEVWLDSYRIASFKKSLSPPANVKIPRGIRTSSEEGLMNITGITSQSSQIEAKWRDIIGIPKTTKFQAQELIAAPVRAGVKSFRSFFSRLTIGSNHSEDNLPQKQTPPESDNQSKNYEGESSGKVFLQMNTISISTRVKRHFAQELERATKKLPPSRTKITTLTSAFAETKNAIHSSGNTSNLATKMFSSVLPSQHGRIFIGFPTNQTTGMLVHVSAPSLIPTVERESIDLNARYIRTWNKELLQISGLGCRVAYANQMSELAIQLGSGGSEKLAVITPDAINTYLRFTAKESTPSSLVGTIIETAFWDPSNSPPIDVVSSQGILPSHKVRVTREKLSFLNTVPVIPEEFTKETELFIEKLFQLGLISQMTIADVKAGLESRALSEKELVEFLDWCGAKLSSEQLDLRAIRGLFEVTIASISKPEDATAQSSPFSLAAVKYFHNATKIPSDMPVPLETIPFVCTKSILRKTLLGFGWDELQIVPWVQYLLSSSEKNKLAGDAAFATQVLNIISKQWESLSQSSKNTLVQILSPHSIMPTSVGMKRPEESYFPSVRVFNDLPIINLPMAKEKMLTALGVRKTVELDLVFSRLNAHDTKSQVKDSHWSHGELIKYFASVADSIPQADMKRLQQTAFCPAKPIDGQVQTRGYKVLELYAPGPLIRELGLPIIDLPFEYRGTSAEGKLLLTLGLKTYPTALELIQIMARSVKQRDRYEAAMRYFIDNHRAHDYGNLDINKIRDTAFLPTGNSSNLLTPTQCFGSPKAQCLGFNIIRSDLIPHAAKFGVREHPPITATVDCLLQNPPLTEDSARVVFAYMATRLSELDQRLIALLGAAKIIPQKEKGLVKRYAPNTVFLGQDKEYVDLLKYVDLGPEANLFLAKIGSKFEPTSIELASLVLNDPPEFYNTLGLDSYLRLLRKFAENEKMLKGDQRLWTALRTSPILIGFLEKSLEESSDPDFEEVTERIPLLIPAEDIIINDNMSFYLMLRNQLIVSPDDDVLERFYASLGVKHLTGMVTVSPKIGPALHDQTIAESLRKLIIERCSIFLHDFRDSGKHVIRHDAKWIESNLQVKLVNSVAQQLALNGSNIRVTEQRTALLQRSATGKRLLSVIKEPDYYDISRELIPVLLMRAKHHDPITLEQILKEPLRRLAKKGYNVERILRKKEAAEAAERQRIEEHARAERQRREEALAREKSGNLIDISDMPSNNNPAKEVPPAKHRHHTKDPRDDDNSQLLDDVSPEPNPQTPKRDNQMPGAFDTYSPDSPSKYEDSGDVARKHASSNNNKLKDFFSKRLGFGQGTEQDGPVNPKQNQEMTRHNIQEAIKQCRSHDHRDMVSKPSINEIEEAKGSYCDSTPAQNLRLWGRTSPSPASSNGIPIFISKNSSDEKIQTYAPQMEYFAGILTNLQRVFKMPYRSLHIFYDDEGSTIAFNAEGALFFNSYWFISNFPDYGQNVLSRVAAHEAWFMSACHETAHNLVKPHNAAFTYYLQRIALEYLPEFRKLLKAVEADAVGGKA